MQVSKKIHRIGIVLAAMLIVLAVSAVSFADLRIVTEAEGVRSEILMKNNRILTPMGEGDTMIVHCSRQEVTLISGQRYWTGSLADFGQSMKAMADEMQAEIEAEVPQELAGLLGGLFGGAASEPINVRVTRVGTEQVGQYQTTHYKVETGHGNNWSTYENLWMSGDLLRDVKAEVGNCYENFMELGSQITSNLAFGMEDMVAVLSDPEYLKLFDQGYPVKTVTTMSFLGMSMDLEETIVEVSRAAISEDVFSVPSNYRQVQDPLEILGY